MTAKWTIAMVNYKTSVYMHWQFKCLFEFNDPKEFTIVIVDNSRDEEEKIKLAALAAPYNERFNNIKIIDYAPVEATASGQHGEGMTLILKEHADTKYILFQDPDFFWVKQNILKWFESILKNDDMVAVGAPYSYKMGGGQPDFPCAYGCAHKVADIKHLDLMADASQEARDRSFKLYPLNDGYGFSYDVGWKLRDALSDVNNKNNYVVFPEKVALEVNEIIGRHSYATITRKYLHKGALVAYHLFRGSFTGEVNADQTDPQALTPQSWLEARYKFGELFYKILCNNGRVPYEIRKVSWKSTYFVFKQNVYKVLTVAKMFSLYRFIIRLLRRTSFGNRLVDFIKRQKFIRAIREKNSLL